MKPSLGCFVRFERENQRFASREKNILVWHSSSLNLLQNLMNISTVLSIFSWEYFPHDHARSRAYRWGEDGLLGITDRECRLCFGLALWNEKDPILKERLFGLTGTEGKNHSVLNLRTYVRYCPGRAVAMVVGVCVPLALSLSLKNVNSLISFVLGKKQVILDYPNFSQRW